MGWVCSELSGLEISGEAAGSLVKAISHQNLPESF
jgi:hypothetical protein